MMRSAVLAVTNRSATRKLITETTAGKKLAGRFVAGSELTDAIAVAKQLNEDGLLVSLDYLGEHVTDPAEAARATDAYLACIDAIEEHSLDANISVKLTQLGMGLDDDAALRNLDRLAFAANTHGMSITIDMEESDHTEMTVRLFERVQRKYGNLGIAIQAYLFRSPEDVRRIGRVGGHVRLCKGAYAEPQEIAHRGDDVEAAFDELCDQLMGMSEVKPAIATHDDARIAHALAAADGREDPWEFQMLYGVRRDRQLELAGQGHDMRIYVPYGEAWYPYLTRRMAERPANMAFFLRAVVGK